MTITKSETEPHLKSLAAPDAWPAHVAKGPRKWSLITLVVLLSVIIFWDGARRTPTPPASGTLLRGDTSPAANQSHPTLRVGTFNICSGKGLDGRTDLTRDARMVKGCDLIGLQEVRGPSLLGSPDQAEVLGRALGMQWLFAPSERQRWHDSFGNAVLSTLPVTHWMRLPVSVPSSNGCRSVLMLQLPWEGRTLHVLITHLDKSADRGPQLRMVLELFRSLEAPALLMGDLNTFPKDPKLDVLHHTPGAIDVLDRPDIDPIHRRDWILIKGLRCTDAGSSDDGTSDHPFYWATLAPAADGPESAPAAAH